MKDFIIKTLLFSLPLATLIAPIALFLKSYGEVFVDFDSLVLEDDFKLVGQKYSESNTIWLKSKLAEKRKAEVLALGSSRVLQFREEMFSESFFNYGYTTTQNYTILPTLKLIPDESLPKLLILGLDQWNFNMLWDKTEYPVTSPRTPRLKNRLSPLETISFVKDIYESGLNFSRPKGVIGMNAIQNSIGFRHDGSRDYGDQVDKILLQDSTIKDYNFRNTLDRIKQGNRPFEWGDAIDCSQLNYVRDLISFCEDKGMELVLFLPPFAPSVWHEMVSCGKYDYVVTLSEELSKICNARDVAFFDFTSQTEIVFNDSEMLDGFHGSERVYARMLLRIAQEGGHLKKYIAVEKIENRMMLESELNIFDDPSNVFVGAVD